jgi:hypothetical protein
MRNSKKLIAVIMTVALLASMMVPALAASYQTEADRLTNAGLMNGTPGTGLDTPLTRAQGITFTVRAMGAEAAAAAMTAGAIAIQTAKLTDFAAVPGWATNFAAYAMANGITNGNRINTGGLVTFSAADPLSGKQFITMMLRALGYTGITLDNCLDKALASGMLTATAAISFGMKAQLTRDDAAYIIYNTVNNGNVALAGGVTVGAVKLVNALVAMGSLTTTAGLNFSNYIAPTPVAPIPVTVGTVSTSNLVEILVTFNTAVDADAAADETNYDVEGDSVVVISSAAVQADGKSVLLTLDVSGANVALVNDGDYTLTVSSDVAAIETSVDFAAVDSAVPVLQSIKLTGPDSFDLTFSEPIDSDSVGAMVIEVADGVYSGTATGDDSAVVSVAMGVSSLTAGNYSVKVSGAMDFAGYTAVTKTLVLAYVVDTTPPTATITSADQTEVVITFNEKVEDADGNPLDATFFWHSNKLYVPDTVAIDGSAYTLTFTSSPLPEGVVRIVVDYNGTDDDVAIQDLWGNALTGDLVFTSTVIADLTKPTVKSVTVDSEDTIIATFSEGVVEATAEDEDNYVIKQAGVVVTTDFVATYNADDYTATLVFDDVLDGAYTISFADITDDSINTNTIVPVTMAFTVKDVTGMDLTAITAEGIDGTTTDTIIVRFPDDVGTVGTYSVLNKANYQVRLAGGTLADLDSSDTVVLFGTDAVKITIADETTIITDADILVGRVADSNGNNSSLLSSPIIAVSVSTAPTITGVVMATYKTLEVTFNGVLNSAPVSGFTVKDTTEAAGNPAGVVLSKNDDGFTVATLTLKTPQQLSSDAKTDFTDGTIKVGVVAGKLKADTGMYVVAVDVVAAGVAASDGIAPAFDTMAVQTLDNVFVINVTEGVTATNNALAATDLVIKDNDGTQLVAGVDFTVVVAGTTITVTFIGADYTGYIGDLTFDTIAAPLYIYDATGEGDKLAANGDALEITAIDVP